MFFILRLSHQQSFRVGQERSVDESQSDVVPVYAGLADPRAHRSTILLVVVAKPTAVLAFSGMRGNIRHNIPALQDDISQLRRYILQAQLNEMFGKHFLVLFSPSIWLASIILYSA